MASEFASIEASESASNQLVEPGPVLNPLPGPIPSFQDLTDSSGDERADDEDWEAIIQAAEEAFSEQQISDMTEYLKERGLFAFVSEFVDRKSIPIRTLLLAFGLMIPAETPYPDQLRMLKIACSRVLRNRERLEQYQTVEDAVALIRKSKKILILTGAGVSTSCGIPDFRSPTGLYARLKAEGTWELDDPQDMFDMRFFRERPDVFYSFAKEIYPSNFVPSPCHRFVRLLELNDKLLRNYTQNIDGLFEQVGCEKMLNCHGSFATASCLECRRRYPGSFIEADVFASRVPLCPPCTAESESLRLAAMAEKARRKAQASPPKKKRKVDEWGDHHGGRGFRDGRDNDDDDSEGDGESGEGMYGYGNLWKGKAIIKPDIVFFGENLSDEFDRKLLADRDQVDLLIVMGTSLRVSPVAQLPSHLPHSVPQILINRDPVSHHNFDICLLGDGDTVVEYLCERLQEAHLGDAQENVATTMSTTNEDDDDDEDDEWNLEKRVPVQRRPNHHHVVANNNNNNNNNKDNKSSPPQTVSLPRPVGADDSSVTVAAAADGESRPPVSGPSATTAAVSTTTTMATEGEGDDDRSTSATSTPERVSTSHVWLFPGANRDAKWIQLVRQAFDEEEEDSDEQDEEEDERDDDVVRAEIEGRARGGRGGGGGGNPRDEGGSGAIGTGETQVEGTVQHLDLAADLAPGIVAGQGSDGSDDPFDDDDEESEDGTEEKFRTR